MADQAILLLAGDRVPCNSGIQQGYHFRFPASHSRLSPSGLGCNSIVTGRLSTTPTNLLAGRRTGGRKAHGNCRTYSRNPPNVFVLDIRHGRDAIVAEDLTKLSGRGKKQCENRDLDR